MQDYIDIPRIYTGIAEIMCCFLYGRFYTADSGGFIRYMKLAAGLLVQCAFLEATKNVHLALWIPCMMVAFALMYTFLVWTCALDKISLIYVALKAFLLAEFIASAEWQIYREIIERAEDDFFLSTLVMILVYGTLLSTAYFLEKRLKRGGQRPVYSLSVIFAAALIAAAVFAFSNLGFIARMIPVEPLHMDIFNSRTLVDLGGLAILYAYQFRIDSLKAEKELAALKTGLQVQYDSYRNYQETLELMHMKFHDLKHHTLLLRQEQDPKRRDEHLNELERELTAFQPEKQTGNRVLDIILAGKSVRMKNLQIQFTCVADGSLLEQLHVTDICTIFGNALDNAIEHVALIPDPNKRIISMSLTRRKEFVFIEISNYCENMIELKDGLPVTTKKDLERHGYGARSMAYAVQKYGGNITFEQRNGFFEVKILIPVNEQHVKNNQKVNK